MFPPTAGTASIIKEVCLRAPPFYDLLLRRENTPLTTLYVTAAISGSRPDEHQWAAPGVIGMRA
jgi:hypothetical protein